MPLDARFSVGEAGELDEHTRGRREVGERRAVAGLDPHRLLAVAEDPNPVDPLEVGERAVHVVDVEGEVEAASDCHSSREPCAWDRR
jgi:hypothetical protein